MAKKTVADFKQNLGKEYVKIIKTVKNKKGNYTFKEMIVKTEDKDKYLGKIG